MTECITDYIDFCTNTIVPVRCFPNNKPWILKDLKELPKKQNKQAFTKKDKEQMSRVQKVRLRENLNAYGRKPEGRLHQNNAKEVWAGRKQSTSLKAKHPPVGCNLQNANELNLFFSRFSMMPSPTISSTQHHSTPTSPRINHLFPPGHPHHSLL